MKKLISTVIIVFLTLSLLSSCNNDKGNKDIINYDFHDVKINFTADDDDFLYEMEKDRPILFAIDNNGYLYYNELTQNFMKVTVLGLDGEKIDEAEIEPIGVWESGEFIPYPNGAESFNCIAVKDNVLYFTDSHPFTRDSTAVFSYNFNTKEQVKIAEIEGFNDVRKIIPLDGKLYLLGIDERLSQNINPAKNNYKGESIISVALQTGEHETVFDNMPFMMAETEDGVLIISAYAENGGYYFKKLNSENIIPNDNLNFSNSEEPNFEMYGSENIIHDSDKFLVFLPVDGNSETRVIVNNLPSINRKNFAVKSGYLFYETGSGVRRIKLSEEVNPAVLNMAHYSVLPPIIENFGFGLTFEQIDTYELSLSLLSLDSNYDMYNINSFSDISDNIRQKGAFYPLNDVPYVNEYLNAVFPYVREAAINEDGDIWMLPIYLHTNGLLYNEKICEEYDIDIAQLNTSEDLIEILATLKSRDITEYYDITHPQFFFERSFYQIMRKNNEFNRDDFREMALYIYDNINYIKDDWSYNRITSDTNPYPLIQVPGSVNRVADLRGRYLLYRRGVGDYHMQESFNRALEYEDYDDDYFWANLGKVDFRYFENYKHNRFILYPSVKAVEGIHVNDVTLEFITVNPHSENLDVVLEYISALAEYQLNLENSFILHDEKTYSMDRHFVKDAYEILNYEGNFIRFSLDSELIYSDFEKFLGDEITLDEYLNRAEFKINAYLRE
ncbi:MAG: hypothetical protein FWG70_04310 [Oscillospiraceae bacterium]|nr:hypothetical protein [Oscillospiraceae bacterium]